MEDAFIVKYPMRWRRIILRGLGLVVLFVVAALVIGPAIIEKSRNRTEPHPPYPVSPEAAALHDQLIIGDWHADSLLWNRNLLERASYGHVDIPRLQQGNVAIQSSGRRKGDPRSCGSAG